MSKTKKADAFASAFLVLDKEFYFLKLFNRPLPLYTINPPKNKLNKIQIDLLSVFKEKIRW